MQYEKIKKYKIRTSVNENNVFILIYITFKNIIMGE